MAYVEEIDGADLSPAGLANLYDQRREQLRRMVALRMDHRVQGRIDPSDVLEDAFLEAAGRLPDYLDNPVMPPFVWLRFIVAQKLLNLHRKHLGSKVQDAAHGLSLYREAMPEASCELLANQLLGHLSSPTFATRRSEMHLLLETALNSLEPMDREILALRHFEQLTNSETAEVLALKETTASNRYLRALQRLKDVLSSTPDGDTELVE